jgi:hypothetical protein
MNEIEIDIMMADIREQNGPLDYKKMEFALFHKLFTINRELEDILLLMCLLKRWSDVVDPLLKEFKEYHDQMMTTIVQCKKDQINHKCIPHWESYSESQLQL